MIEFLLVNWHACVSFLPWPLRLMSLADPDKDGASVDAAGTSPLPDLVRRTLNHVREQVSEQTWSAFWRSMVDGQSSSDVAAELGISSGAVRKAKARVLAETALRIRRPGFLTVTAHSVFV